MGNKSRPELTLSLLVMTALCLEAYKIQKLIYIIPSNRTWMEARLYCQHKYVDLVTLEKMNTHWLAAIMKIHSVKQVWIGLHRDLQNDSVWRGINLKTGEGISGDDMSQIGIWADGQQSGHCAFVSAKDLMWYSFKCSLKANFYCSGGNQMQYKQSVLSWYNASHYCQDNRRDLLTVTERNTHKVTHNGWIGLYRQAGETWRWIGGLSSDYRNWAPKQPLNADCAIFDADTKKCYSKACSEKFAFLCLRDNLVLVNENKTWESALRHCQKYYKQLMTLDNLLDYNYTRDRIYRATTDEVWLGLRFLGGEWWWTNGEMPKDQGMLPDCPSQRKHCGTLSKYDTNNWIIRDCSEKRNFLCYR